jgi:hypothetical protein
MESKLELRLDNDQYDPSRLVHIKVSADRLPYSNSSTNFDRTDGQIDIGSIHYRYVGKRLYNDSVEFLCLPDQETSRLHTARDDFFSLVNDLQNTGHAKTPGSSGKTARNVLKVCFLEDHYLAVTCFPEGTVCPMAYRTSALPAGYSLLRKLPPRREGII